MSDAASTDRMPARRRLGPILLLVFFAFLIGGISSIYLVRNIRWLDRFATPRMAARQQPAVTPADNYVPPDGQSATGPAIDTATLQSRESTLAAQLAALEARTAALTIDAAAAGTQAGRAEAVLATAAARRAVDRGQPLGAIEGQLRARFGTSQPAAVAIVIQGARQPVTLEDLRQGLDTIAASLTTGARNGWLASLKQEVTSLIVLRRVGTPSPLPADRLARARRLVEAGQVEAARAEVARLPGAKDAANWESAAKRYVAVRRALDLLEYTALTSQAPQPVVAPPASQPTGA